MTSESLSSLFETARKALLAGGKVVREGFRGRIDVKFKSEQNPVTQIDLLAEKTVIGVIKRRFPTHSFLAEEMSHLQAADARPVSSSPYRWIIDPLDGTVNFIHGIPQSAVSVAVVRAGRVLAGGVYDPHRDELFMAARGRGASLNGQPIRVSKEKELINSLLITGFPYDRNKKASEYLSMLMPFLKNAHDLRRFGAAALDLAWIACGRAEGFMEYKLSPWDVAAGSLLVEEAGGRVTDFKNRPFDIGLPVQTLATNGHVHPAIMAVFRRFFRHLKSAENVAPTKRFTD